MAFGHVQAQVATEYFDGNAYNALLSANGTHFNGAKMFVPSAAGDTTGPSSNYSSSVWIGGKDQMGELHIAAERFISSNKDFEPGPIADFYDSTNAPYNRLWKIDRSDIYQWLANISGQTPPPIVLDWPGNGRNYSPYNESQILAPFVDANGDGKYNPTTSFDYPKMRGDQSVYFVYNDAKSLNTQSNGLQMGVEVRGMAYGFNCPEDTALNQTLFMHYEITNHSSNTYDSVFLGLWNDFDLGNPGDDYVGSDTLRNLFYAYNGDDNDENTSGAVGYGNNLPAQGVRILNGIFMDYDGVDNQIDSVQYFNGFGFGDGIVDNERLGLSQFVPSHLISLPIGQPYSPTTYYKLMRGDYLGPPTGPTFPGDRRVLGSMGPFTMLSNQTIVFDIAYVFAQSTQGRLVARDKMIAYSDHIQELFDSGMTPCGAFEPEFALGVENITAENVWKLYPNPTTGLVTISASNNAAFKTQIFNAQGELVAHFASSNTTQTVDLNNLSRGVYFVKTASERFSQTQKLILQ